MIKMTEYPSNCIVEKELFRGEFDMFFVKESKMH